MKTKITYKSLILGFLKYLHNLKTANSQTFLNYRIGNKMIKLQYIKNIIR